MIVRTVYLFKIVSFADCISFNGKIVSLVRTYGKYVHKDAVLYGVWYSSSTIAWKWNQTYSKSTPSALGTMSDAFQLTPAN